MSKIEFILIYSVILLISMNTKSVSKFSDIEITPNTLVICDIDDTIIKCKECFSHFYQLVKNDFEDFTHEQLLKDAWNMRQMYNRIYGFTHTDPDGWINFLGRITQSGSRLVFLTARTQTAEKFTRANFESVGINYDDFQVYYTENVKVKGLYIQDHIDLSGYDQVIFIDDNEQQIKSVIDSVPGVQCYKFEIPGYKNLSEFYLGNSHPPL